MILDLIYYLAESVNTSSIMVRVHLHRLTSVLFITTFIFSVVSAQQLTHVQGEIMFSLKSEVSPHSIDRYVQEFEDQNMIFNYEQVTSEPINIWLLRFDHNNVNEDHLLNYMEGIPGVYNAQKNHIVKIRQTPNDPEFNNQWQYINTGINTGLEGADLDMDLAWELTTGGLTAQGDTIVVCVIDDGIDLEHEDLKENLWRNYAEIPSNGIDDDNNGYIDDYLGWNSNTDTDQVQNDDHGTSVSGIIGAKGNNGIGVSGVNWNVKIMTINAIPAPESGVVAAYSYAWTQRKKYNDTNGAEGAFIVATNSSFGIGVPAEEAPLWCDFYNTMGEVGIISTGATSNSGINVDVTGDVPSNCNSDYLIVATNLLWNDEKRNAAGYGVESVDLGAYGQNVYTTYRGNTYSSSFGGTSAATPHVTGVAALLYANDCDALIKEAKSNPAGAALAVKNYIFNGVIPNESLDGITTTGGKLNAANTLQLGTNACSDCPAPISLTIDTNSPFSLTIDWTAISAADSYSVRYRENGTSSWTEISGISSPYTLDDLMSCNPYEIQVQSNCNGLSSDYGFIQNAMTTGCCELPDTFEAIAEDDNLFFNWDNDQFTTSYLVEYRLQGDISWSSEIVNINEFVLTELPFCQTYEARLTAICGEFNSQSQISEILLATSECGSCTGDGYCAFENGPDNGSEWIDSISIGGIQFQSGQDPNGYGNHLGGATTTLLRGSLIPVTLTPGFTSTLYDEYFTIWIDWNNDEEFDEETELAYDPGATTDISIGGSFLVPEDANLGNTRLRVIMSFESKQGPCDPGNPFRFGEVEDYCVDVTGTNSTNDPLTNIEFSLISNPVLDYATFEIIGESALNLEATIYNTSGKILIQEKWNTSIGINNIKSLDVKEFSGGLYLVNITDGQNSRTFKLIKL